MSFISQIGDGVRNLFVSGSGNQKNTATTPSTQVDSSASTRQPTTPRIDVGTLLERKLDNPNYPLTPEERIALVSSCINWGDREASRAENQDLVIFIGNTGSGKSTMINYLYGCTMERVNAKKMGITALKPTIVRVKDGGEFQEIMRIGHSNKSTTFMPEIASSEKERVTFCDCPGFLDNRGIEINVANAVNIKNALTRARSVKIVMLVNYASLDADKARGLREMISIVCDLFGTKESLQKFRNSILLGVTNIPRPEVDSEPQPLDELKAWFKNAHLSDPHEQRAVDILTERFFIYDPLDQDNLAYTGAWNRQKLLREIRNLHEIPDPSKIFKTVLTAEDKQGLLQICEAIKSKIEEIFRQQVLSNVDFAAIAEYLGSLTKLSLIEHAAVQRLLESARQTVGTHFRTKLQQIEKECLQTEGQLSEQSEALLGRYTEGLRFFDVQIQEQANVTHTQQLCEESKARGQARAEAKALADKAHTFVLHCNTTNFKAAQDLLTEIKAKASLFQEKFSKTKIPHGQEIEKLEKMYVTAKSAYEQRELDKQQTLAEIEKLKKSQEEAVERMKKQEAAAEEREKELKEQLQQAEAERRANQTAGSSQGFPGYFGPSGGFDMFTQAQRMLAIQQQTNLFGPVGRPVMTPMGAVIPTGSGYYPVVNIPQGTNLMTAPEAIVNTRMGPQRIFFQ